MQTRWDCDREVSGKGSPRKSEAIPSRRSGFEMSFRKVKPWSPVPVTPIYGYVNMHPHHPAQHRDCFRLNRSPDSKTGGHKGGLGRIDYREGGA